MRPFSRRGSLLLSVAIAASFISNFSSFGQVLTPPYFNLAEGRRINASSTCGEGVPEPELYCKLVGADTEKELNVENLNYQGQVRLCFHFSLDFTIRSEKTLCSPLNHIPHFLVDKLPKKTASGRFSLGKRENKNLQPN